MLLATIVLLGAIPQSAQLVRSAADLTEVTDAKEGAISRVLPSMPKPKVTSEADATAAASAGAEAVQPTRMALSIQPVKPAYTRPRETRGQRIAWYTLAVTGHGAAAFDAYSTRLAVSGGYGTEGNPFLRPFSHSGALYAATQVSPVVMDYLGKHMMISENRWVRRMWWLPQVAGSGFSIGAGMHNLSVVR